ncbi:MAG: hypothetical protein LC126_16830 [Bryobacterales bacterium]|nr:hypothetical protein [Bryobacterales bacterium]
MPRLVLMAAVVLSAANREKASDWPVHAAAGKAEVGAEYMVHSVIHGGETVFVRDYLAVEVALFPVKGERLEISQGQFSLRVNGQKTAMPAQTAGMVAASVKYADWEQHKQLEATAGVGDASVILGRPRTGARFPGDPTQTRDRLPSPPKAPAPEDRSGIEKPEKLSAEEIITRAALREGETEKPARGYLYFVYKGNAGKIRKLELAYTDPAGTVVLPLR